MEGHSEAKLTLLGSQRNPAKEASSKTTRKTLIKAKKIAREPGPGPLGLQHGHVPL